MRRRQRTHIPRTVPPGQLRRTLEAIRRLRTHFVFGTLMVLFLVLLGRLAKLQIFDHDSYLALAERRHRARQGFAAERGRILDRFGRVLAQSRPLRRVAVDPHPQVVDDPELFALAVARLLDNKPTAAEILKIIRVEQATFEATQGCRRHIMIRSRVEDPLLIDRLDTVRGLRVRQKQRANVWGLLVESGEVREYPNDRYAYHVLGTVPYDGAKVRVGIEGHYDKYLSGRTHWVSVLRDGKRNFRARDGVSRETLHRGGDVQLTLDVVVQHHLEDALDQVVLKHNPTELCGIVMDPHTGEVLAWANRPNRNGNLRGGLGASGPSGEMDYLTRGFYEVGSVFKPITVAWALERGVVGVGEVLHMPIERRFPNDGKVIHDSHFVGDGTVVLLLEQSSNTGAAELGRRLGSAGMQALWSELGLAHHPAMEFPYIKSGYLNGEIRKRKTWPAWAVHRMAYGQSFTLTPLQLATLYCALARSDGRIVKPSILLRNPLRDPRGPRLCDPKYLAAIRQGMRRVVTHGTAKRWVRGSVYPIAGKTGTAQQPRCNVCTFAGFAPADDPQMVCLVLAKMPLEAMASGGEVSGPAVRAVLDATLSYLRVPLKRPLRTAPAVRPPVTVPAPGETSRPRASQSGAAVFTEGQRVAAPAGASGTGGGR